jgi:hypothetical protein
MAIPRQNLPEGVIMFSLRPPPKFRLQNGRYGGVGRKADKFAICRGGVMTWTWTPLMLGLATVWGVFTVGLIVLLIYRSTLTMHEEEQLYLDDANSHMQQEQTELLVKVERLTKPVWVFGAGSGVLLLVLLGMFIYQGLNAVQ